MQTEILIWIQSFAAPWLDKLMMTMSFIGDEDFCIAAVPFLFYAVHKKTGIRLAVVLLLSTFANEMMKLWFQSPRPIGVDGVRSLYTQSAPGYSFPSGHSQSSSTFWGYLAACVKRRWFTVFACLIVLSVMVSRMYLGVHWPMDVLGGLTFGVLFVSAMVWADGRLKTDVPFWLKLGAGVVLPLLLLFAYHEADGRKMMGFLLGSWVGYVLEQRFVCMKHPRRFADRLLPSVLGVVALFALQAGLARLQPVAPAWEVVKYAVLGLVALFAVPWAFVKLGWYKELQKM